MERYRIVIADDHSMMRHGLRRIIEENAGLEVIGEAGDGLELLELLKTVVPDLVILDMSMPKIRGIDAINEIKKRYPAVKVLVLSMHKEYLCRALSAGASGYILKEDADRELFSSIEHIRHGRTFISPRLADQLVTETVLCTDSGLSTRETEILRLIAGGRTNREIAEVLSISIRTVESHRARIMDKLDLKNVADLIKYAIDRGH